MFDHLIIIIQGSAASRQPYEMALGKFTNVHYSDNPVEALQFLESSPAYVAIIGSDCEDMTGLEVAEAIRDIDNDIHHFTYVCLVGDEAEENLIQGAVESIDCHIRSVDESIAAMTFAAMRLSARINALTEVNLALKRSNQQLQSGQLLDPLTGLGNKKMAEQSLRDSIRQIESRGGAVCVLKISVTNFSDIISEYEQRIADELIVSVAEKIDHLVRPLDIVTYFESGVFALILVQPSIEHCTAECYQRIYDGVRLKSFQTAAGFLPANIAMSICASHALNGPPSIEQLFEGAANGLNDAEAQDKMIVTHLTPIE